MGARVAVAGATGYAGGELLRLLAAHPGVEVAAVTGHDSAGARLGDIHPQLRSLAPMGWNPEPCGTGSAASGPSHTASRRSARSAG